MDTTLTFKAFAEEVRYPTIPPETSWCPLHVRLMPEDVERFSLFCRERRILVLDPLDRQLQDLAEVRLPEAQEAAHEWYIKALVEEHGGRAAYGTWVYLPWETKVVHLLDEAAYVEVRTNRNRDKITREEQRLLGTRRVGVIGLSVGGEAAVTVAQERLCGEIVLADFDRLDLSNLNRLGAGVDALGLRKTTIVARRIAKIDPYLTIRVFDEGVTEANMDAFLDGLDLVIDECDGLQIKYQLRTRARERGLNLIFAADERGFVSIEPYGYWPDLLPFHGRVDGPQPPRETYPTPLAFWRALTVWMGGWEHLSDRSRQSVDQIGHTLCGYPQLAGEARYAAGQLAHVARRLLLGERLPPFMGHLDLDHLLSSPR